MSSLAHEFLSAIVLSGKIEEYLALGSIRHLMHSPAELELHDFLDCFVKAHGALPSVAALKADAKVDVLHVKDNVSYYHERMRKRHITESLKKANNQSNTFLKDDVNNDPEQALKTMTDAVSTLHLENQRQHLVDFKHAGQVVIPAYKATAKIWLGVTSGVLLGWPTLDKYAHGLKKGDVLSVVGKVGAGKTYKLLRAAHHVWQTHKKPVLVVSMEMSVEQIMMRLVALHHHFPVDWLQGGMLPTTKWEELQKWFEDIQNSTVPFHVVDGNLTSNVDDVWLYASQLKPGLICIDGAYLLRHPTERDRYKRVAENCDLIKQKLAPIAPTICSWQFAKEAAKAKKKGEKVTTDHIGYSNAIAEISSIILGMMDMETVATLKERTIEVLKGRSGETGAYKIKWDFKNMDFGELYQETLDDLSNV